MDKLLATPSLKYFISAAWGLALAIVVFQKACKRKNCIVIMSEPTVPKTTYQLGKQKCVRFEPVSVNSLDE